MIQSYACVISYESLRTLCEFIKILKGLVCFGLFRDVVLLCIERLEKPT